MVNRGGGEEGRERGAVIEIMVTIGSVMIAMMIIVVVVVTVVKRTEEEQKCHRKLYRCTCPFVCVCQCVIDATIN